MPIRPSTRPSTLLAPRFVTAVLLGVAGLTGCGGDGDDRLVVFAASSLTDAFDRIEREYEAAHPGVDIVMSYGGSSSLVAQLADGAPVDVLATADTASMDRAVDLMGPAGAPALFATNSMVIAVERGNPLGIATVADLSDGPVVVLAAPEVPAGAYASQILACEGVAVEPASLEQNVRSAAAKVALGEADAALVYLTDLTDDLEGVAVDPTCQVVARYPIVALTDGDRTADFVADVIDGDGRRALADAGFGSP